MSSKWHLVMILAAIAALITFDADAGRLGGGRSSGTQRPSITQKQSLASPATAQAPAASTAAPTAGAPQQTVPAPSGARRWLGPLAGLAAGIGLAALFSHFGLSEGFGSVVLLLLITLGGVMLLRLVFRSRPQPAPAGLGYSGPRPAAAGLHTPHGYETQAAPSVSAPSEVPGVVQAAPSGEPAASYPVGFDPVPFLEHAKRNFTEMQAAFDRADTKTLREMCTAEMFAEIEKELGERKERPNQTDVVRLEAAIVEVAKEGSHAWASVRYHGLIREHPEEPAARFDEVWNLRKDIAAGEGWLLAGIQQLN